MKDSSHLKGKRAKPHHGERTDEDRNHDDADENAPLITTAEESDKLLAKMIDISAKISDVRNF